MNRLLTSRREFLKTTAVAGAAAAGLAAPAIAQSKTREINMVGWNSQALLPLFARSEKEIGIKINYDVLPAKWDEVMQKITLWGQTGYSDVDVMFADDLIGGLWGMNGWADDLSGLDAWTKNSDDIVDNITVLNKAVGGVYRVFFTMGLEPFFYNKSMIATPPTSWEEFVSVAKAHTDVARGVAGWRPLGGEGHAFNTVLLALNQAGANLDTLDDAATLKALQFMADWVQADKITPPSTVSEDNAAVEALAGAGKAAMWWTYDNGYNNILSVDGSTLTRDSIGVARWPKGPVTDNALAHGWGYMRPKASKRKDAAAEVINWLAQPEMIKAFDLAQSAAPPYKALFKDPQIVAKLPILTAGPGWEEMIRGARFREPIVNHRAVTQLWTMFDKLGSYVLSGQKSPKEAQAWAMTEYQTI